ncbi:DHH family protein phosphoesterase [Mycoplasmopsis meleagridis]|uniref:DHH family protein phosphoesterase n=1 Tax=Mycoplasmopsis meleagridis ATCC 25294 TaxID=1264554 RepID=A0A0F5H0C7_9BACT|nr:bifunctional oligoribonuclease/PAP phosphatase NrnA [Mycoplasmopsis meleagridis]KKB26776.1 DHH family protein phosphoesterase [Mycoplasmopsis meleagridis ATCC 25294]KUH47527.1 PAP phosphatase [Mycoplasmopsis meleagridis]OAD18108.1 DHH family protein phosphoesterase [Mycoplasmopsis meleagridis]VEU77310.1 Bifunctional oligoribonuclease and PAP phosphatase nrnA [Mycoplasmopsis meleagridis]
MHIGSFQEITKKIEEYDSIIIFHHIRPDGDCLGSQFGLRELLRINYPNKKIYAVGDSKGAFKNFLNFDFDNVPNEEELKKSLGIIVDANYKERIEKREILDAELFKETLRIDHHPNEDDLSNCTRWIESSRIAAAEMIAELAYQNKWKFNQEAANFVFLGIVTDSGRFSYSDVNERTHELAAFLYKNGLDAEKIFSGLALTSFEDLQLQSILLANLKTSGKVAYTYIDLETSRKLNKKPNEVVRVNLIGNIKDYPLWVQFIEEEDGKIRTEYRSNGPIVRNVAIKWGGGGHERASGSMIDSFSQIDAVIKDCNEEVERYLNEMK